MVLLECHTVKNCIIQQILSHSLWCRPVIHTFHLLQLQLFNFGFVDDVYLHRRGRGADLYMVSGKYLCLTLWLLIILCLCSL